jgi:Chaperone of endosialidase
MKPTKTTTPLIRNSINRTPLRRGFLLIPLAIALAWFGLLPMARAQLPSPTPDGGYPNDNTAEGEGALQSNTTGSDNTATGFDALFSNTAGSENTAIGSGALANSTASLNTATGFDALFSNTTGSDNTATGFQALLFNTTGSNNTATGVSALEANTTGSFNTAIGREALISNTTASDNTATGFAALLFNTTGSDNTATGEGALANNTTGSFNTANGGAALGNNRTGNFNTATGRLALSTNNSGLGNTANGYQALLNNTTGASNTALGNGAGLNLITGSNNIDIGANVLGKADDKGTIRIGNPGTQRTTVVAGIFGTAVAGSQVVVNSNGQLGVATSSGRFKQAIKPMDKASEAILALKPVTFRYKHEIDPDGVPQFGLVAEQVEKVNPDLVARDADGKVYTVRYEAVNAMLLNEFLKEHKKVEELEATVEQQQKVFAARLKEQDSKIQAVNERLERATPLQVADSKEASR